MYRYDFRFRILISIITKIKIEDFQVMIDFHIGILYEVPSTLASSHNIVASFVSGTAEVLALTLGHDVAAEPNHFIPSTGKMASPTKRRKKSTSVVPHQSRNLDFFFGKQRQAASTPRTSPPKRPDLKVTTEGLTDEEYAHKLAEEWAKDGVAALTSESMVEGSKQWLKRGRSLSPVGTVNAMESFVLGGIERKTPETIPDENKQTIPTAPPIPKAAISIESALESDALIEEMPFDKDPLSFDPDTFKGILDKWPTRKAPYALLTRAFVLVNLTRSRIKIVNTLVNLLRTLIRLDPESLLAAVCFIWGCLNFGLMRYHSVALTR